ncbi:MAG: hypothetical protein P4L50_03055 [Anaerolineaceae bacterium]|nr:hypothetical protein [Anaerolineaceae bacterium]
MQAQKTSSKSSKNLVDLDVKYISIGEHLKQDIHSKLVDGLLAALFFLLLMVVVDILVGPINQQFGNPGLLVYTLAILALSVFTLDRSLNTRLPETTRAWYGLIGGMLGWSVALFSSKMAQSDIFGDANILIFILVALVVATLWRRVLPIGCKFFALALSLSWIGQYLQTKAVIINQFLPSLNGAFNWESYLAILAVIAALFWLFYYSDRRLKRLWSAIWIWFFLALLVYAVHGTLI